MKKNYQAISVLVVCSLFLFYKYIAQLFPSLISNILIEQLKLSGIQIGILASSYYYSYSVMQVFSGIVLDRFSIRSSSYIAILIVSIAMFLFINTDSFVLMCLSRALMGVGCAFATTLYLKCAAAYTSDRTFGFVSSLLATATMLGAAIGVAPIAMLLEHTGWYHGLAYIAFAGFFLSLLSFIFINLNKMSTDSYAAKTNLNKSVKGVFFNPYNIWLLLYSGITFSPIIVIGGIWGMPFIALKFQVLGSSAATLISIMFIGHAIGSPIWSLINLKKNNRRSLMLYANAISFFCLAVILFAPMNFIEGAILFFLFGFSVGCFMLCFEICREINNFAMIGIAVAFINSGEGLLGVILEPGIGLILDWAKAEGALEFSLANYQLSLSVLLLCYIVSTAIVYRLPHKDLKAKNKDNLTIENGVYITGNDGSIS